jgi:putative DNA primase/helicase
MSKPELKIVSAPDIDAELDEVQKAIEQKDTARQFAVAKDPSDILPPAAWTDDDLSNARRFDHQFGKDFIYVKERKAFYQWTGKHWAVDNEDFVYRLATEFVADLYAPENLTSAENYKHAKRSNNAAGMDAMIKIFSKLKAVSIDRLDRKADHFNCKTGTIYLPTGEVLPHTREDLITKIAPFDYNPDADCSRFLEFLIQIQPVQSIRDYLQQVLGYSMSATYRDRAFFILYGYGRNGKSVFLDLFSKIFGGYAQNTTADSLMKKPTGSIPNDIARLRGCRFITCAETEEGKRLHESMLKQLTGGDVVTARFLFSEYFDFYFSGKIFIATNHKPAILDTSQGFWDRLKLIPFTVQIEPEKQIDKDTLLNAMLDEAAGILAWLVKGFQKYQERRRLIEPAEIRAEVETYRFEQDSIAQFIDQMCELWDESNASVLDKIIYRSKNGDVYAAYKRFCDQNGEMARTHRRLSQNLKERGFHQVNENGTRYWHGLRLNE